MAAYAWTPSALTWLHVNHLINGLHKQISWKNCLYADNLYFMLGSNLAVILIWRFFVILASITKFNAKALIVVKHISQSICAQY